MSPPSAWSGSAASFLTVAPKGLLDDRLAPLVALLQDALRRTPALDARWVVLDWRLLRLGRRIDAVIATDCAVLAVQFRPGAAAFTAADRHAAEDAALDLAEFHSGSNGLPVVPIVLIPNGARPRQQYPLPLSGATPPLEATRLTLPGLLTQIARFPAVTLDGPGWAASPYAPVAGLLDAASMLYRNHGASSLRLAAAGPDALRHTQAAVAACIAQAKADDEKWVIFVTGSPGAGKTLCGLDLAFGRDGAAFLTGNPTLVHVLRATLVRDAAADARAAARRVHAVIQALANFRDHYVGSAGAPAEPILVIDEAQRCWSRAYAVRKTKNHAIKLTDSEPGHLLDIMSRRPGWAVLVCLLGGGQEIHDGEGGLASWGEALQSRPQWSVLAPPNVAADQRQRLPMLGKLRTEPRLHLAAPVRAVGAPRSAEWVDAMLADAPDRAAALARDGVPFTLTRSLETMRAALGPRGHRTAGLVASSTARRLRAEGLGAVLPHQDAAAVASWFLDRWPDIRSGDALEVVATEFGVQGLELDRCGLCWDGDLIRGTAGWQARRFRATRWTHASAEARANRLNAYRVLLTRARHGTIIWIPRGDRRDPTRNPAHYDAVAAYLLACGVPMLDAACGVPTLDAARGVLDAVPVAAEDAPITEPALL